VNFDVLGANGDQAEGIFLVKYLLIQCFLRYFGNLQTESGTERICMDKYLIYSRQRSRMQVKWHASSLEVEFSRLAEART